MMMSTKKWKRISLQVSHSAVAGGRELVELCPAAMSPHNRQQRHAAFFEKNNSGEKL
jgi:hypothetical protein